MKIQNLINDYLERTKIYKKNGTYLYYRKVSRAIIKALNYLNINDTSELKKNTQTDIIMYYKKMTKKKNSQINADVGFLYQVLKYYDVKHELTRHEKLPDDTTSFRALNDTVLNRLLSFLRTLDINVSNNLSWVLSIYLMLDTGVRMNELLNIKTKNVDMLSNSIILETTKNNKKRVVFFDVLSKELLKIAIANDKEYIIWNHNKNERMNRVAIFYFMDIVAKNVESDTKIHAHRLRKTFATRLLKNGCPLTTIQKLLGHSDIKMTMKYLEIDQAMIEKDYFNYYPYQDVTKEKKQP